MSDEAREGRRRRTRSFLLGSVVGASAVVASARRRRRRRKRPVGLAAFEGAPCFRESASGQRPDRG